MPESFKNGQSFGIAIGIIYMIDIVIVNWNTGEHLANCVSSVLDHDGGVVSSIVVVDNGSKDGSETAVEATPAVELVRAGENLGFGRACNLGARRGSAEYILFLNPDTRLFATTLEDSHAFMASEAAQGIGICGVQLIEEDGAVSRSCARFPSVGAILSRSVGLDRIIPRSGSRMSEWDHSESRRVDQVIGAYFLIRRSLFEAQGGFDERFFVYYEEVDLAYRCAAAGWQSWYLATTQAFHAGGGASGQVKAHRLFYGLRSRLQYSAKHFSVGGRIGVQMANWLLEPFARGTRAVARFDYQELREIIRAYSWLLTWAMGRSGTWR